MASSLILFITVLLAVNISSLKLPSYIKPCSLSDPKFSECAIRNGQSAIPHFINGDKKYRIPKLNPLLIKEMIVDQGGSRNVGLKIIAKNALVYGLDKTVIKGIKVDVPNRFFKWTLWVPRVEIITKYKVDGRILLLPLSGSGDGNVTLVEPVFKFALGFDKVKKGKLQKEYLQTKNASIEYDLKRAYINLDNLFGGNKLLGDQMNKFMDENWREIVKELGPSIAEAVSQIANSILSAIADLVPFDEIFLK